MTSPYAPVPAENDALPEPPDLNHGKKRSPFARSGLWAACTGVVLLACLAIWLATLQPWLGLHLVPEAAVEVVAADAKPAEPARPPGVMVQSSSPAGPAAVIVKGSRLVRVAPATGEGMALLATDVMEEPDVFNSYQEWGDFYKRQALLAGWLRDGPVNLTVQDAQGQTQVLSLKAMDSRPVDSLPPVFWFQLFVGSFAALVGVWILAQRWSDLAARCLALTGAALLASTFSAAVYSTRELAVPQDMFWLLSSINHFSAAVFGIGLVGIFVFHPQQLFRLRWFVLLALVYLAWAVADVFWWIDSPDQAYRLLVLSQMLLSVALGIWQWRRARGRLIDRAALRWVLLSFLVGAGAFIVLSVCTLMLGWLPPIAQGYAFGLFLTMYIGLALGVKRHRVFDLDAWSLRALMWLFGVLGIVSIDALLISQLQWNNELSLVISMVVCAALYFPLRQWVWEKVFGRLEPGLNDLTGDILSLGLAGKEVRVQRWTALLGRLFGAGRVEQQSGLGGLGGQAAHSMHVGLLGQGMGLQIPAVADMPALAVWDRDQGKRLFSSQDQRLASRLHELVLMVVQTRDAYSRGVAEERARIASDLHDDLGAHLLSIVHASSQNAAGPSIAASARRALDDLRLSVRGLTSDAMPAQEVFADWRAETLNRLELAHIDASWQQDDDLPEFYLSARMHVQLTRVLREVVSNVIRHSQARRCALSITLDKGWLTLVVADDGKGLPQEQVQHSGKTGGHGLANIERRANALGGHHRFAPGAWGGAEVTVSVPVIEPASSL